MVLGDAGWARHACALYPLWLYGYHVIGCTQPKRHCPLAICYFNDRPPYNQLYSAAVPLFSLVNTDIHQYPISFSWSRALYPPPRKKKRKVCCCCCCYSRVPIFLVTKTRFVLGSDTSGKTNIGGSLSQRLPWLQSHFPDDWIQSVLSLAASPDSQRRRDISDSDVLPYRLQAAASKRCGWKEEEKPDRRPSFDLDSLSHSSCTFEKRLSQWSPPRHEPLVRRYTNKSWSATLRGQTGGASGVNVSTSPARREVSYRLLEGQGQCPL